MLEATSRAGDQIRKFVENNPRYTGILCEFAAIRLSGDSVVVGHLGLARVYRLLPEGIEQLTQDHSGEAALLRDRKFRDGTFEDPAIYRNITFRFLGQSVGADVEVVEVALIPRVSGNRFLLATDGLWKVLQQHEIEAGLRSNPASATDCCESLVSAASQSGDNVTVMVVDLC